VDTPLEVCEARDPKGLYKRARKGEIPNMTGINSAYEAPERPDVVVSTESEEMGAIVNRLAGLL
jgi:adenylylsulfate kinase-like enzyme